MGKNFNPFSSAPTCKPQGAEKESQLSTKLLQLAKPKEKKDKKKKKGKGDQVETETKAAVMLDPQNEGDIFYCWESEWCTSGLQNVLRNRQTASAAKTTQIVS